MTIGDLIAALEGVPAEVEVRVRGVIVSDPRDRDKVCEWAVPGEREGHYFHSYRGYYDQIALSYGSPFHTRWDRDSGYVVLGERTVRVADLLPAARAAVGATFEGYKGGDYTMNEGTPLWIAEEGSASSMVPGAVTLEEGALYVTAAYIGDYA